MYSPKHFVQEDQEQLTELIKAYPFATLVSHSSEGLEADHLPLSLSSDGQSMRLRGHIAKANPLWKHVNDGDQVLVIFQGPDSYISPSFYPSKEKDGKVVPTWNYLTVHARGAIKFIEDAEWLVNLLSELTDQQESLQDQPWKVEDAPADYTEKLVNAIVGLEIEVASIEGKWKVSQNQSQENQEGVASALENSGESNDERIAQYVGEYIGKSKTP